MEKHYLEKGYFYHIFNRGNNSEPIFFEEDNYLYFLKLIKKYLVPTVDFYAFCLLKNHFHFIIRIKEDSEINALELKYSTIEKPKKIEASLQFSHFFNAYTQAVNKRYKRTGSIFEKSFERIRITNEKYLKQSILYVHHNPIHHHIAKNIDDYKWSSYKIILSDSTTVLKRKEVLELFGDKENFKFTHNNYEVLNLPY